MMRATVKILRRSALIGALALAAGSWLPGTHAWPASDFGLFAGSKSWMDGSLLVGEKIELGKPAV